MAYNVQFKKVLALPADISNHVFYAVYEKKSTEGIFENLQKVYLGNVELSSVAVNALINTLDANLTAEIARAKAAEEANAANIATNATGVANNKAAIEAEVIRAKAAEEANTTKINTDIAALRAEIGSLTNIMNFRGAYAALPTPLDGFSAGDVIIITEGENAGKEYVLNEVDGVKTWVEIGHASATDAALAALAERVATLEGEMDAVETRATNLEGRATAVEGRVTTLEGEMDAVEADVAGFKTTVAETYATKEEVGTLNTNLTAAITEESNRAKTAEGALDTAIKAETTRAQGAEAQLAADLVEAIKKVYGNANADTVDLGKLVLAINQLVDSTSQTETDIATVTTGVTQLDARVTATENLLTWEE